MYSPRKSKYSTFLDNFAVLYGNAYPELRKNDISKKKNYKALKKHWFSNIPTLTSIICLSVSLQFSWNLKEHCINSNKCKKKASLSNKTIDRASLMHNPISQLGGLCFPNKMLCFSGIYATEKQLQHFLKEVFLKVNGAFFWFFHFFGNK